METYIRVPVDTEGKFCGKNCRFLKPQECLPRVNMPATCIAFDNSKLKYSILNEQYQRCQSCLDEEI